MTGNLKNILSVASLLALVVGGYFILTNIDIFMDYNKRAKDVDDRTAQLERDVIMPLEKLTSVKIDKSFFDTPEFSALVDKSITLRSPVLKRSNPFDTAE
jgi:hypothetical protein